MKRPRKPRRSSLRSYNRREFAAAGLVQCPVCGSLFSAYTGCQSCANAAAERSLLHDDAPDYGGAFDGFVVTSDADGGL